MILKNRIDALKNKADALYRFASSRKQLLIILSIVLFVILWMLSGIGANHEHGGSELSERKANSNRQDDQDYFKLQHSKGQPYTKVLKANAVTAAHNRVTLPFRGSGKVVKIDKSVGDSVKQGDVIARLDPEESEILLKQQKVMLENARIFHDSTKELYDKNMSSIYNMKEAKYKLHEAQSGLEHAEQQYQNTMITAPFDGYIDRILVKEGDVVSMFHKAVEVVDLRDMRVRAYVSPNDILKVQEGAACTIYAGSSGGGGGGSGAVVDRVVESEVTFVSKVADVASGGMFLIEMPLDNADASVMGGYDVKVEVHVGDVVAHNIAQSTLLLNQDGVLGVNAVEKDPDDGKYGKVVFYSVEIVGEDNDSVWVEGLPDEADVVVLGQSFLSDGQRIAVKSGDVAAAGGNTEG